MNITVENLGNCKKLIRVEVSPEEYKQEFDAVTNQIQKTIALPGFRPGKTPKNLIVKRFEKEIDQETRENLARASLRQAIEQHKLVIIGKPEFEEVQFGAGLPYLFVIRVETAPEFELPEYKGIHVKRKIARVTEEDIEKALNILREKQATYQSVQRPVQKGDVVVVNFVAYVDSRPLTEIAPAAKGIAEQKNFWIGTEPETFLPGFGSQLIGANIGEKRQVSILFPAGFQPQELVGVQATYEVEILDVKQKVLPELNDEFAKSWGAENMEKLREGVQRDLERELQYTQKKNIQAQIIEALLARAQFELPESLVAEETRDIVYDIVAENARRGVSKELLEQHKDEIFRTALVSARDRVKLNFLLFKIAEKEGISATPEEILRRVYALAAVYQIAPEKLLKDLQKRGGLEEIRNKIIIEKTLDFLEANAVIEDTQ